MYIYAYVCIAIYKYDFYLAVVYKNVYIFIYDNDNGVYCAQGDHITAY